MGLKYEFTNETINHNDHLLHRIRRLSDGKLGGWLEKEENLSQEGNCWVDDFDAVDAEYKQYNDDAISNIRLKDIKDTNKFYEILYQKVRDNFDNNYAIYEY